ncbi:MAG TPA: LmbE family protein [Bacteroidetes bacterium]|nr:LmbE family protein [Bacteroidota bacterium]
MKNNFKTILLLATAVFFLQNGISQDLTGDFGKPQKWTSADIHQAITKLRVLGSALYLAAHPDDENTRLISYLSNGLHMNTAYLSLTRGDGGQNLIGPEIRELLGVIRTQELLAARRIDGGSQMFSRANDFGYSKNPEETQRIWNKDEVMADIVWAIRKWRPDIIINRFNHQTTRRTHGHHTASAKLSVEAFSMAADPNAFPEQLKYVETWQPRRLFFNTSWWFYGSREKFAEADKSNMVAVDAGVYYPLKGKSNNEIAAESRSMHKCQGMGSTGTRGGQMEYLDFVKGDKISSNTDPFAGINTTWSRVKGGRQIGLLLEQVAKDFQYEDPSASVPLLMKAYAMIENLPDGYWKKTKSAEIKKIIAACMGMFTEAIVGDHSATPGQQVELSIEAINRSPVECRLISVEYLPTGQDTALNVFLQNNEDLKFHKKINLPEDLPHTNAYWLNEASELGMYTVKDQRLRGLPETPRALKVRFNFLIAGQPISFEKDVVNKYRDRVKGETYRPFEVVPPVFVNLQDEVVLFTDGQPRDINVVVKSGAAMINGNLTLARPKGWRIEPEFIDFSLKLKGEEQVATFKLYPPAGASEGLISPIAEVDGKGYTRSLSLIEYDHIPAQMVLLNIPAKVARMDLKRAGDRVAYIMGAGDKIPENLRQIGYQVDLLDPDSDRGDITAENLKKYDALILGVRAYNTRERLKFHQQKLLKYVEEGGTMIVQYNTNHALVLPMEDIAPYPLKISRDRVTVEEAEVRFLAPEHQVLNFPNKITKKDFENWKQERGLYFPNEWAPEFTPILSCNDPGEPARDGGLLVAKYGKGYYIYTGYSWFRELPPGVTGAYRIFANLIGVGKGVRP